MSLIPYVGTYVVIGYYMILMRDVAWGLDRGLPRFGEYREILRRAWDGFLVGLVWSLVLAVPLTIVLVAWAVSRVAAIAQGVSTPAEAVGVVPWWILAGASLGAGAIAVVLNVAILRTAVYLKPSAGLKVKGIRELISRDAAGFRTVTGFMLAVFAFGLALSAPSTYLHYWQPLSPAAALSLRYGWGFVGAVIAAPLHLMVQVAYGLWAKDTDPSSWPPLHEVPPAQDQRGVAQLPSAAVSVQEDDSSFTSGQ